MNALRKSLIALSLGVSFSSNAGLVLYSNPDDFYKAVGSHYTVEDFESFSAGDLIENGSTVSNISYSLNDPTLDFAVSSTYDTSSGSNYLQTSSGPFLDGWDKLNFGFQGPVNFFGLNLIFSDMPVDGSFFMEVGGQLFDINPDHLVSRLVDGGYNYFAAFTSDMNIENVTFRSAQLGQSYTSYAVDDVMTGQVPEPPVMVFFLMTIAYLVWLNVKKKSQTNATGGMTHEYNI